MQVTLTEAVFVKAEVQRLVRIDQQEIVVDVTKRPQPGNANKGNDEIKLRQIAECLKEFSQKRDGITQSFGACLRSGDSLLRDRALWGLANSTLLDISKIVEH